MEEKKEYANKMKLKPSLARVLNMDKNILVKHFYLISIKASSLSKYQRDLVVSRVAFMIKKGMITEDELKFNEE